MGENSGIWLDYLNKKIGVNSFVDFSITTGSGRSKGKYSIEIKPCITVEQQVDDV